MPQRIWLLATLYTMAMSVFALRLFHLQVLRGSSYESAIQQDRVIEELLPARRGRILDRQGTVLVDNRPIYHLAVILRELEHARRERRRWPHIALDEAARAHLVADIATYLDRPVQEVRTLLEDELERFPGCAVRHRQRPHSDLGLLAVDRNAARALADDARLITLGHLQVLSSDARIALEHEVQRRWDEDADALDSDELAALCARLDARWNRQPGFSLRLVKAYLEHLTLDLPEERMRRLIVLGERGRLLISEALARANGVSRDVALNELNTWLRTWRSRRGQQEDAAWYYVPGALSERVRDILPETVTTRPCPLVGAPPGRERIHFLQGDPPDERDGMFSLFCRRLHAGLGSQGDWLPALILQHGEAIDALTLGFRFHPQNVVVFDHRALRRFCDRLAATLQANQRQETSLAIEQALARARRRADRAWAGSTVHDPIVILPHIGHRLAIALSARTARTPEDLSTRFRDTTAFLPGLAIVHEMGREYRHPGAMKHVIGHMGRLSATYDRQDALGMGLDPEGWKGISGLEQVYDASLHGVTGRRLQLRSGSGIELEHLDPPQPGQDLRTTIDADCQLAAERALENWYELAEELGTSTERMQRALAINRGRAGLVLMDPQDGAILAMASTPKYRDEDFRHHYQELAAAPNQPLLDHASTANQPPGSCMKVLTAMIVCAEGRYGLGETIYSAGSYGALSDHPPAGQYDLKESIAISSNVVFAKLAERIGAETYISYAERFGLGRSLAIDIPWQRPARAPTPRSIDRLRPTMPFWVPFDTRLLGIGQLWNASPLELITIPAAVANGGQIVRPHLAADPRDAVIADHIELSAAQWEEIRRGMEMVTDRTVPHATATHLVLEGPAASVRVAAKTGTSEWGNKDQTRFPDHAWLIGYAPAQRPTVCFAIFIFGGTSGGRACSGVAKQVLETYFTRYGATGHR